MMIIDNRQSYINESELERDVNIKRRRTEQVLCC